MVSIIWGETSVRIVNSCQIPKREFGEYIALVREYGEKYRTRSFRSLKAEWATHNFLYRIGYKRERTKDVDLDFPQVWYMTALYYVCGALSWLFIP